VRSPRTCACALYTRRGPPGKTSPNSVARESLGVSSSSRSRCKSTSPPSLPVASSPFPGVVYRASPGQYCVSEAPATYILAASPLPPSSSRPSLQNLPAPPNHLHRLHTVCHLQQQQPGTSCALAVCRVEPARPPSPSSPCSTAQLTSAPDRPTDRQTDRHTDNKLCTLDCALLPARRRQPTRYKHTPSPPTSLASHPSHPTISWHHGCQRPHITPLGRSRRRVWRRHVSCNLPRWRLARGQWHQRRRR
jgi:hypothetical protein